MKIRCGFVSNSSSSSFVVYTSDLKLNDKVIPSNLIKVEKVPVFWELEGEEACVDEKSIILPCKEGEADFGWADKRYTTLLDRLNWCALQIMIGEEYVTDKMKDLVEDRDTRDTLTSKKKVKEFMDKQFQFKYLFEAVVKEELKVCIKYDYNSIKWDSANGYWAGIDHQSLWWNKPINAEVFKTPRTLKSFLFNKDSYIQGGNDNSEMGEDYQESLKKMDYKSWKFWYTDEEDEKDED